MAVACKTHCKARYNAEVHISGDANVWINKVRWLMAMKIFLVTHLLDSRPTAIDCDRLSMHHILNYTSLNSQHIVCSCWMYVDTVCKHWRSQDFWLEGGSAFFVTVRAGTAYRKIWRLVNNFFAHIIRFTVQKFQLFWVIFCIIIFFIEL